MFVSQGHSAVLLGLVVSQFVCPLLVGDGTFGLRHYVLELRLVAGYHRMDGPQVLEFCLFLGCESVAIRLMRIDSSLH